jgi:ribosomal-protein-alanine N-acetyltransferase
MSDTLAPVPRKQPVVIMTTPRLILRTATEQDIPVMHARVLGDGEVMRYVFQGVPMTLERAERVMRKFFTFGVTGVIGISVLADRPTDEIVGFAGLVPCEVLGEADLEIGFVLTRHAWGRGIATEIGKAQLAFGFEQLNRPRLLGLVDPRNGPSIRVLRKLGLQYLKDVTEPLRASRSVFCIEADAWRVKRGDQAP